MNRKIIWGIVIIIVSLFYIFKDIIPDSIWKYVFNYQVIIMLIGIYLVLQKKKIGWGVFGVGLYVYLITFFEEYFRIGFPTVALLSGAALIGLGIKEIKVKNDRKEKAVFKSSSKENKNIETATVEEAEEIK